MTELEKAARQALDYIVATNKSSEFWLVPESNLNKIVTALRRALEQQPAAPAIPEGWKRVIPGGKYTDQWDSSRIADYNKGWNDYRKAAHAALERITEQSAVQEGKRQAAQWLRNNYQDYPNIASLCEAMLAATPEQKGNV